MNRRELLKSLPAIAATPLVINGKEAKGFEFDQTKKYAIFVDAALFRIEDVEGWCQMRSASTR